MRTDRLDALPDDLHEGLVVLLDLMSEKGAHVNGVPRQLAIFGQAQACRPMAFAWAQAEKARPKNQPKIKGPKK